eukprot:gene18482-21040_t
MDDQTKINTEAGLIYTYLKARFDVDEYAGPLMWLIRTQVPKADILDGERVKTIMDTVKNCVGYPMWFTAHLMFQSALILIIFDHYKALHLKDVTELVSKYPQFSSLPSDEQKQLLKFRNLLVVAIKIFDPRENPVDVLSLMESICGHTSSACTTVKKRLHREQIFLRETGIAAEFRRKKPKSKDVQVAREAAASRSEPIGPLSPPIVRSISTVSSTSNKRPVEPPTVVLPVPAKKKRVESTLVADEASTRELCASAAEGAYDILRQYCAYSSSSDNSDDDDDCDTNDDEDSNLDQEEEEEDEEGSLQSVSEEEEEKEGEAITDGSESFKGQSAAASSADVNNTTVARSRDVVSRVAKLDAGSSNNNTSTSSALNSIIDTANELADRNRRTKTLTAPRSTEKAETKNSNASNGSTLKAPNTMHQNNVRTAAENVLRAVTTAATCGPMHAVLNAHMGCYEPPLAPVYSTPSTYNMYNLPPFPPLGSYTPNGPGLTFNPAQYQYNSAAQPGGGLYSAYGAQYAAANNNSKQLCAPQLAPLPMSMSMSSASSYPYSNPYSHPVTSYQHTTSYPSLPGTHQIQPMNANSNPPPYSQYPPPVYNAPFPPFPGALPPAPAPLQANCSTILNPPQVTVNINTHPVPYCVYPPAMYNSALLGPYPAATSSIPVAVPIVMNGTTVNGEGVQINPPKGPL